MLSTVQLELMVEVEEEEVDFLELGGYVAKESIEDVTTGPNLTDEQRREFKDLANQFTNLFTEAPGTTDLVQHHIKLTSDEPDQDLTQYLTA